MHVRTGLGRASDYLSLGLLEGARGQVWITASQFKHLDSAWREILAS